MTTEPRTLAQESGGLYAETDNATDLTPGYVPALDDAHPLALSFPDMRNGWLLLRRPDGDHVRTQPVDHQ